MFLGPIVGGFLASDFAKKINDPSPHAFPFAVPMLLIGAYCVGIAVLVLVVLEDRQEGVQRDRRPLLMVLRNSVTSLMFRSSRKRDPEHGDAIESDSLLRGRPAREISKSKIKSTMASTDELPSAAPVKTLPFRRMWTANVVSTMLATFMIAGHLGTFTTLWPIFLSASSSTTQSSPLHLTGGLSMDRRQVAVQMSMLGLIGVLLQVVIYPYLSDKYGTIKVWRSALWFFPIVYFVAPFCTLAVFKSPDPDGPDRGKVALGIAVSSVLILFTIGRTGVTPATSLLINDCTPHPSVRGTIHTTGTVVGNLGRSIFPAILLPVFGYGLSHGTVGLGFWCLMAFAVLTCAINGRVVEGSNGKEIVLE